MVDVIIIGAGPAGMTAGIYTVRKNLDTVIISPDMGGQTLDSAEVENYLGYTHVTGEELVDKFKEHLKSFEGIRLVESSAKKLEQTGQKTSQTQRPG